MSTHLSFVAPLIPDFHVLRIDRLANSLIDEGKDVIKLNLGKSEVPMERVVADEIAEGIYDEARREIVDAQGLPSLRREIVSNYLTTWGINVTQEQIFVNNGTSPFFLALYLLLLNRGDEVLLPSPYYPPYFANTHITGVRPVFYPIHNGRIDLDKFSEKFTPGKTKLVLFNSPGNPLGNVINAKEFKEVLDIIDGNAPVISDEIYDGFVYEDNFTPILSVANPRRDFVIVLNGFSKAHHMYTRRLGYAIVPHALIEPLLRFQRHNVVCVDPITQFAGLVSLRNRHNMKTNARGEVVELKKRLEVCKDILSKSRVRIIEPAGSFYLPIDVSAYLGGKFKNSLELAEALLVSAHVAVTPGEDFGKNDLFRIGLTSQRVAEGVQRIMKFLCQV